MLSSLPIFLPVLRALRVLCTVLTAFLFSFFVFYKFHRQLCHGAYWCTYNLANMPILLFHLQLPFSNSCICVFKHVYAFPSSCILIHIYCHIYKYVLCPVLYLKPCLCFLSSSSTNLIDTYVTVPIDVRITPLIYLDSFASTSSFLTSLPPLVSCIQMYIHISIHPPAPLFETLVPLCVLLWVNSCGCVPKLVYAFPSSTIFIHTYRHPHIYGLCSVLYLSPFSCFLSSVSTNFIDTYVTVPIHGRTTCKYAYPLFPSVSPFL